MNDLVARARDLAHRAHAGQADKAGRPYIEHVARVAAAVSDDPEAEAVAWLHDVLEDTPVRITFPTARVLGAVITLTRDAEDSSEVYYARIRADP